MVVDTIALILAIIGALNWGAMGLFGVDLIASMFGGSASVMSRVIFSLIGIAGLWSITILFKDKVPIDSRD